MVAAGFAVCGAGGCALQPGHDGDCVRAHLCGVDPAMSQEARDALDDVLQAAHAHLVAAGPHPNAPTG